MTRSSNRGIRAPRHRACATPQNCHPSARRPSSHWPRGPCSWPAWLGGADLRARLRRQALLPGDARNRRSLRCRRAVLAYRLQAKDGGRRFLEHRQQRIDRFQQAHHERLRRRLRRGLVAARAQRRDAPARLRQLCLERQVPVLQERTSRNHPLGRRRCGSRRHRHVRVGAESFSTITPAVFVGRGFGDLPEELRFLRPLRDNRQRRDRDCRRAPAAPRWMTTATL